MEVCEARAGGAAEEGAGDVEVCFGGGKEGWSVMYLLVGDRRRGEWEEGMRERGEREEKRRKRRMSSTDHEEDIRPVQRLVTRPESRHFSRF